MFIVTSFILGSLNTVFVKMANGWIGVYRSLSRVWAGQVDFDLFIQGHFGLNGSRRIKRWWLLFNVIEDFLDCVWVSYFGDDTPPFPGIQS